MARTSDTYSNAYDACDNVLFEEGRFPTVEMVRDRIGVNSPAVIKRAINDWLLHFVEKHKQRILQPNIPKKLLESMESLWAGAVEDANQLYEQERLEFIKQEEVFIARIQELEASISEKEENWGREGAKMQEQINAQAQTIAELRNRLEKANSQIQEQKSEASSIREELSAANAALNEARTFYENQAKEWADKSEKDHLWHLKRIEEEKNSIREQHAKTLSDQARQIESAKQEHEAQNLKITQIMNQVSEMFERLAALNEENAGLRRMIEENERAKSSHKPFKVRRALSRT